MEENAPHITDGPLQQRKYGENDQGDDTSSRSGTEDIESREATPPPSDTGLDTLGGGMRKMVELVNKLRAAGIEGLGLGLPRIAVVGNQSAGKSSLIEAISGIKVPRYTGTCTRCPLEINLSEPEDPTLTWQCKVSLRFNKKYSPASSGSRGTNNPWVDQSVEQHLFLELSSKEEVEGALMTAQSAVLNPSKRWKDFAMKQELGGSNPMMEDCEVKFSPNVVCLEITEPGLPNLAFIDLPGVIQTTESDSEDYLIDLVTNLVKEYVKEEDCLILLAMTMKDDAVNQSAARLAREMGEERTVGALTKPDTVCPGEFQQWVDILRGKAHKLKHGYFVTKQPSQDELVRGISHAEARRAECEFFSSRQPWATELSDMSYRFGTVALTKFLAQKLGETIRLRLPGIVETIRMQAENVRMELNNLPPPATDNHFYLIQNLLTKFSVMAGEYIQGGNGLEKNKLQTGLKHNARELGKILDSLTPRIQWFRTEEEENFARMAMVREESPSPKRGESSLVISLLDDDSDGESWDQKAKVTEVPVTPHKPAPQPLNREVVVGRDSATPGSSKKRPWTGEAPTISNTYTLSQINKIIESNAGGQIPDQVDSKAVEYLAKRALVLWDSAIRGFLDACQRQLLSVIHSVFVKRFQRYQKTPLYTKSYDILEEFLNRCFERQVENVLCRIYKLEKDQIATLNEATFKTTKGKHHEKLLELRARNREDQREIKRRKLNTDISLSPKKRAVEEKKLQQEEKDAQLPGNDKYANEIELVAGVRAYYELATRRFVDNVFMSVLGEWVKAVKVGLRDELWMGLGFGEEGGEVHANCRALLEEDPEKERRRLGLEVKREQLRKAMEELNKL
ncbi:P-loop containing nucleoside triphosphate hydrolase protein [Tirmania nivea]|nr:P-loop containing nucleoside triphosphate hydrolase protein [Tirmania nivea]